MTLGAVADNVRELKTARTYSRRLGGALLCLSLLLPLPVIAQSRDLSPGGGVADSTAAASPTGLVRSNLSAVIAENGRLLRGIGAVRVLNYGIKNGRQWYQVRFSQDVTRCSFSITPGPFSEGGTPGVAGSNGSRAFPGAPARYLDGIWVAVDARARTITVPPYVQYYNDAAIFVTVLCP